MDRLVQVCRSSPHPLLSEEESESESSESEVIPLGPEDTLEGGEHLLYVNLRPEEHLRATGTTSQCLTGHPRSTRKLKQKSRSTYRNSKMSSPRRHLTHFHLGNRGTTQSSWNLGLSQLIARSTHSPQRNKVELDAFLEENLHTGRIRPSKSPMASPVFFIKKKDGSLQLVQDYQALNSVMVKNRYPIPLISELIMQL